MSQLHVLIATHTPDRLAPALLALARQSRAPDSVVVSVDGVDPEIESVTQRAAERFRASESHTRLILAQRAHTGEARLNQVRNNGLRGLSERVSLGDADLVVTLDGDIVLHPDTLREHAGREADVVAASRVNLDADRSTRLAAAIEDDAMTDGLWEELTTAADRADLARRAARANRAATLRRSGLSVLVKAHKPKLLGAHHGVRVRALRAVNGYDEAYVGYGYDDDDLARRLHAARVFRWSIAIEPALAYHLHHATRAPDRPTEAPGFSRFESRGWTPRAAAGWTSPADQPDVEVTEL